MDEIYRIEFGKFRAIYTETFTDYYAIENAMQWFAARGESFKVWRSNDSENWERIVWPYNYRAPGRVFTDNPGEYDCDICGLVGGH